MNNYYSRTVSFILFIISSVLISSCDLLSIRFVKEYVVVVGELNQILKSIPAEYTSIVPKRTDMDVGGVSLSGGTISVNSNKIGRADYVLRSENKSQELTIISTVKLTAAKIGEINDEYLSDKYNKEITDIQQYNPEDNTATCVLRFAHENPVIPDNSRDASLDFPTESQGDEKLYLVYRYVNNQNGDAVTVKNNEVIIGTLGVTGAIAWILLINPNVLGEQTIEVKVENFSSSESSRNGIGFITTNGQQSSHHGTLSANEGISNFTTESIKVENGWSLGIVGVSSTDRDIRFSSIEIIPVRGK